MIIHMHELLSKFNSAWKEDLLLIRTDQLSLLFDQANTIVQRGLSIEDLKELDFQISQASNWHLGTRVALKLAISKTIVNQISDRFTVSVVFAVYCEHNRILTADLHPNGEDFLHRKIEQMEWLFDEQPFCNWEMIIVDDGCPNESGKMAEKILDSSHPKVRVEFLEDGILARHPAVIPIKTTQESRKGGSVLYGMALAAERTHPSSHVIVCTDADLSTHLGQTGLLLDSIFNEGKKAAIASRREINSVVIKKGLRNTRGKMFIYLWKRLLPQLDYIVDTQCGFKAFEADHIRQIVYGLHEKEFAFDIELLLKTELVSAKSIEKVAIAWVDSDAETTTADSAYLDMLHSIAGFYRDYLPGDPDRERWARLIEGLDQAKWELLLDHVPEAIANAEPARLGEDLFSESDALKILA